MSALRLAVDARQREQERPAEGGVSGVRENVVYGGFSMTEHHILNLGAGVQSTTLYLMAKAGLQHGRNTTGGRFAAIPCFTLQDGSDVVDCKTGEPTMRNVWYSRSAIPFSLDARERWMRVEIRELPAKRPQKGSK